MQHKLFISGIGLSLYLDWLLLDTVSHWWLIIAWTENLVWTWICNGAQLSPMPPKSGCSCLWVEHNSKSSTLSRCPGAVLKNWPWSQPVSLFFDFQGKKLYHKQSFSHSHIHASKTCLPLVQLPPPVLISLAAIFCSFCKFAPHFRLT